MAELHVVSALIAKRAELAGQIERIQAELRQAVTDLDHIDASLRIFKPDIDLAEISPRRVPPVHQSFRGEVSRVILEALRATTRPLDTVELGKRVMEARGLDTGDKQLVRTFSRRAGACLREWRDRGIVRSSPGPGQRSVWELA